MSEDKKIWGNGPLKKPIRARMTHDLIARLNAFAAAHGVNGSEVVRRAFKRFRAETDKGTVRLPDREETTRENSDCRIFHRVDSEVFGRGNLAVTEAMAPQIIAWFIAGPDEWMSEKNERGGANDRN